MDKRVLGPYYVLMRILFLAAEVAPFVTVGGLSQVMHFLPKALVKRGHSVRVFTPSYGAADSETVALHWKQVGKGVDLRVPAVTAGVSRLELKEAESPLADIDCEATAYDGMDAEPDVVFLRNREYYELRANVFGYADDHVRFALLSKACLEWLLVQRKARKGEDAWWPDVVHCHDWHTGYFIDLARRDPRYRDALKNVAVVYTVHNFRYQGNGDMRYQPEADCDDGLEPLAALDDKRLQKQNALKRGLLYADAVTTVSPTHALEVLTEEYAEGLLGTLTAIRGKLSGILNGIDLETLDPATDPNIKRNFGRRWFVDARGANKAELQRQFYLPVEPKTPLLGYVGRLAQQKGLDLLVESVGHLMEERKNVQLVVVGGGEDRYRKELEELRARFPHRIGLHLLPDFTLPRKVFAGADMLLIPSHFEPGGIVAVEALRYGAVPVVRRTGGMNDSIVDFDPQTRRGNGFSFQQKNGWAMFACLVEALTVYRETSLWQRLVENALRSDFSWDHSAGEYEDWYERVREVKAPGSVRDLLSSLMKKAL